MTIVEYVIRQIGNVHTSEYSLRGALRTRAMSCWPRSMMPDDAFSSCLPVSASAS